MATNVRLSGAVSGARTESDIRVNFFDTTKIAASTGTTPQGRKRSSAPPIVA